MYLLALHIARLKRINRGTNLVEHWRYIFKVLNFHYFDCTFTGCAGHALSSWFITIFLEVNGLELPVWTVLTTMSAIIKELSSSTFIARDLWRCRKLYRLRILIITDLWYQPSVADCSLAVRHAIPIVSIEIMALARPLFHAGCPPNWAWHREIPLRALQAFD